MHLKISYSVSFKKRTISSNQEKGTAHSHPTGKHDWHILNCVVVKLTFSVVLNPSPSFCLIILVFSFTDKNALFVGGWRPCLILVSLMKYAAFGSHTGLRSVLYHTLYLSVLGRGGFRVDFSGQTEVVLFVQYAKKFRRHTYYKIILILNILTTNLELLLDY